jgi:tetratricopeptide (TPR) repeat protein
MTNFNQINQSIPEEVKQIIRTASEDEVVEIMLQSLKMALENPDEMAKAMPGMPKEMLGVMQLFPKTDQALRPMAKAMATLIIQQVKYGKNPTEAEITKVVSEALMGSGALGGMAGMGGLGGLPGGMPGMGGLPGMGGMPGMGALPGMPGTGGIPNVGAATAPVSRGPALDPDVAREVDSYISNGKNRLAEQEFEEAEKAFGSAVDILEDKQPEGDLMFTALQHQSIAQLEQAEYLKAEPVLKRWLRLGEKIYSPEHSLLAGAYLGLARVRESQQKMDDAELLYKRALSIAEKSGDSDADSYSATIDSVAYFYESRKRHKKSDPLFEQSYALRKRLYGEGSLEVADFETEYALVLNDRGQHDEAVEWCKRAHEIKKTQLGEEDGEVLDSSIQLAEIMFDAKQYDDAEAHLRQAIGRMTPCTDGRLEALDLLSQLLRETGRDEEAAAIEKELAE